MKRLVGCLGLVLLSYCTVPAAEATAEHETWRILTGVRWVYDPDAGTEEYPGGYVAEFDDAVKKLAGTTVRLRGFMVPLEKAKKQSTFILMKKPAAGCRFCSPGDAGPDSMIEVHVRTPVKFSFEPVTLQGTLQLREADSLQLFYRLTGAELAD